MLRWFARSGLREPAETRDMLGWTLLSMLLLGLFVAIATWPMLFSDFTLR